MMSNDPLLSLLQLASPALPVGAYSYSEGIETLSQNRIITTSDDLLGWLSAELTHGGILVEAAVMQWSYQAIAHREFDRLRYWNQWLSAFRETAEMRSQSWQMGRSLLRLFSNLEPAIAEQFPASLHGESCNFAIAYSLVAHGWKIPVEDAGIAYLHSWAANLISAAVRSVPLGQTEGQRLLKDLKDPIQSAHAAVQAMKEDDSMAWGWGVSLASMRHETLYSRLFRS